VSWLLPWRRAPPVAARRLVVVVAPVGLLLRPGTLHMAAAALQPAELSLLAVVDVAFHGAVPRHGACVCEREREGRNEG